MDHHRIDVDSVNALREIARASDLMTEIPIEDRAVSISAPIAVLRDLRMRGFITVTLGLLGKTLATMTDAGRAYLAREDITPPGRLPTRVLTGGANYSFGF